jgi:hypothetical protein
MEIFFYKMHTSPPNIWYTNFNGVVIAEWCAEHNVRYRISDYNGVRTGIILEDEKDRVYFELRWGGKPPRIIEDYID